jgi:hypothetical protein
MSQPQDISKRTRDIYKNIIDKLINEIKEAAANEGCSEDTLKELKSVRIEIIFIIINIVMGVQISRSWSFTRNGK